MGLSLRKGYGLDNKSLSGDFASKMWSSYTQLNPGVYSDAIATEFKRRMKPDYVDSAGTGYYYNTFGPSGLNKTTADWIGMMVTSSATVARTNTKTGAVMKWNMDGVVVTQNNLPAYNKGANAGIITFTSTDGFSGVTVFDCNTCNLTHLSGQYGFVNIRTFNFFANLLPYINTYEWTSLQAISASVNNLSSFTTRAWPNLITLNVNTNQLTSLQTYAWPNMVNFLLQSNSIASITNTGTNKVSVDNESLNAYSTAMVDSRLAYYNTMFSATPPIKNLTLNLSGATMGIPTGAGSNTDLLGVLAKFTAAGFTATIIVRTV